MRVLFASTHGAGHFNPLVPYLDACVAAGHEVLVVGPPTLDPRGYPFRAGDSPPAELLDPLWERIPSLPPGQSDVVVVGRIFAGLNVDAMLPALRAALDDWRPDLVVREPNEYASAIAAEERGVRHVRVAIGLAHSEEAALAIARTALDDAAPGLSGRIAASPYLTCFPASLDPSPFPVRRFRDPAVDTPVRPLPDWWAGDERPLVYLSFGSVTAAFPSAAGLYATAIEQVAALPVRVLATVGRELDVGPVPPNVRVERWVPQADVLAHAAAVVCHGGSGTVLGALAAGVPLVVVPLFADQPQNAVRVATVGAGVVASLDGIGSALGRVLQEPAHRAAAARVAAEIDGQAPAERFLEAL